MDDKLAIAKTTGHPVAFPDARYDRERDPAQLDEKLLENVRADPSAAFRALFRGRTDAYGCDDGSEGKNACSVVRAPLTAAQYARHLSPSDSWSIGVFPLCEGDKVHFGAIDFDCVGLSDEEAVALIERAESMGAPLCWARSKSRGLHAYLFCYEPCDAKPVAVALRGWATALDWKPSGGKSKAKGGRFSEVFPKQTTYQQDKLGNFLRLPWPGGEQATSRRGLRRHPEPSSLDQWLAHALLRRVCADDLAALTALLPAEPAAPPSKPTSATPRIPAKRYTLTQVKALLRSLAPERASDYDPWTQVLMALHHEFGGTREEAAVIVAADEWSQTSPKYLPGDVEAKWGTFANDGPNHVTIRSLQYWADEDSEEKCDSAIEELNRLYGHVLKGGGAIIQTPPRGQPSFLDTRRWKEHLGNQTLFLGGKEVSLPQAWLQHTSRRSFSDLAFDPTLAPHSGVPAASGVRGALDFNLWPGIATTPSAAGSCDLFLDHIRHQVCGGDEELYQWLLQWFAHIVQTPETKSGTSVVFRGPPGAGKSVVGEIIGEILGPSLYTKLSRPEELTGKFNGHQQGKLLLQVEEAFWAGSKDTEGALKHLVTSPTMRIEQKFMDPIDAPNLVRLFITSNQDWVVPAGFGERRFAVFDVSGSCAKDFTYFSALRKQMFVDGGCAKLHHHLLNGVRVVADSIRRPPPTQALLEQQLASFPPQDSWLYEILNDGRMPGDTGGNGSAAKVQLFAHYQMAVRSAGRRHREATDTFFGRFLRERLGGCVTTARPRAGSERPYYLVFAPLKECRQQFASQLSFTPPWSDTDEWTPELGLGCVQ